MSTKVQFQYFHSTENALKNSTKHVYLYTYVVCVQNGSRFFSDRINNRPCLKNSERATILSKFSVTRHLQQLKNFKNMLLLFLLEESIFFSILKILL